MNHKTLSGIIFALGLLLARSSSIPVAKAAAPAEGSLIKGSTAAVYYLGPNNRRYVFPNQSVFRSWFHDFSSVVTLDDSELAAVPVAGNVTYRPGRYLVKIVSDPKVYAVSGNGVLRWIKTEAVARGIYGANWSDYVHDIPDTFFINYTVGDEVADVSGFVPGEELGRYGTVSDMLNRVWCTSCGQPPATNANPAVPETDGAFLISHAGGRSFSWTLGQTHAHGFLLVWSLSAAPTFPTRNGDDFSYYGDEDVRGGEIKSTLGDGTYHVRACEYFAGKCLRYSNELTVNMGSGVSATIPSGLIVLKHDGDGNFSWILDESHADGFGLVWSTKPRPTYPGLSHADYADPSVRSGHASLGVGTYFVRVCEYQDGACLRYSNELAVVYSSPPKP